MRTRRLAREEGQAAAEYALMLGGIAVVVAVLVLVLGVDVRELFTKSGSSVPTVTTPPVRTSPLRPPPTDASQCADGGHGNFVPAYDTQEQCEAAVE